MLKRWLTASTSGQSTAQGGDMHPRCIPVSALVVLCAVGLVGGPVLAGAGDEPLRWDLASDFSLAPNQANPNPDSYGNSDVWYFMKGLPGLHDPSTYTLIHEFIDDAFHIPGLEQWQGPHISNDENDKLPAIGLNATGSEQQIGGIVWPAGAIRVHPLAALTAIVGWQSPSDGPVFVKAAFTDLDATCGDGIHWAIDHGPLTIASGSYDDGGHQAFMGSVMLGKGDFLYFIVEDGPGVDDSCDSTGLGISILAGCEASLHVQGDVHTPGSTLPVSIHIAHHRPNTVTVPWEIRLIDASGRMVTKHTTEPHTFEPGDVVDRDVEFRLPNDLASGTYTLELAISGMAGTNGATATLRVANAE